jgi:hypothetical protein
MKPTPYTREDIEVETGPAAERPPPQKVRRPRTSTAAPTWARIPHERALQLHGRIDGAAWIVLIELDRLIFKTGQNPVRLPNKKLRAVGMSRTGKAKALRQLQSAGVVTYKQDGNEAPLVHPLLVPNLPVRVSPADYPVICRLQ